MGKRSKQSDDAITDDVPYTMRLPDGRTVFVAVPGKWCERDVSGEIAFRPEAVRLLDRIRVLAMQTPDEPTPGFIRTLRHALGMTQKELGEHVGVDLMTVYRWERGMMRPSSESVKSLDKLKRQAARKGITVAA